MKNKNQNAPFSSAQNARSLTPQEKGLYASSRIREMAIKIQEFDTQDISQRPKTNNSYIWNYSGSLFGKQSLTEAQMHDACECIREQVMHDNWSAQKGFCTEINFFDFTQKRGGDTFYISDSVVILRGVNEKEAFGYAFPEYNRLDMHVLIGDYNGASRAFLKVEGNDGKYHFAELVEFGMLSTFTIHGHNSGIVTIFDNPLDIEKFDVWIGSPRQNHSLRTDIPAGTKAPRYRGDYFLMHDEELMPTCNVASEPDITRQSLTLLPSANKKGTINTGNNSIIFDVELFFCFLANSIVEVPSLRKDFEEYYETDKYRFYEHARRSPEYSPHNMSGYTLESEVAMRRVYGILLCAEEDESVREYVYKKLRGVEKRFGKLVKNPTKPALDAVMMDVAKYRGASYDATNAPIRFLAYLFYSEYGITSRNRIVNDFLSKVHNIHLDYSMHKAYYANGIIEDFKKNPAVVPKKLRPIISNLKTGFDTVSFHDFFKFDIQKSDIDATNPELFRLIKNYAEPDSEGAIDILNAAMVARIANFTSSINGVSLSGLHGTVSVTKDEQTALAEVLHRIGSDLAIVDSKNHISISSYLTGHIFMLLTKEIRNMKEFYFRNNSETQYLELQRLENIVAANEAETERLKNELANNDARREQQREEIRRLTDELYKENKDAIKPYASEISELNSRLRELEKALEAEQAKNPELNALREFAFVARSEYIPPESTISLADMICGKKVIIVGGHVNWRNRMQECYPTITFLDGHNASFDNAMFDKADYTLFFTSNMSHKVYYRAINYLRDKRLKFGYLGRSKNQELLESEIVSILKEKM